MESVAPLSNGASTNPRSNDGKQFKDLHLNPWFVEWMTGAPPGWSDPGCPLSATEFKSRLAESSANTSSGWSNNESNRKREPMSELTLEEARPIVAAGFKHGICGKITDDEAVSIAQELIDVVSDASHQGSFAPAVLEILHAANIEPLSDATREAYEQQFGTTTNGDSPPEEPAQAPGDVDLSEIFPAYDSYNVEDIKKAILDSASTGVFTPDEWEQIKVYEAAHGKRETILSLEPKFKTTEPEPAQAPTGSAFDAAPPADPTPEPEESSGLDEPPQAAPETFVDDVAAYYTGDSPSRAEQEGLPLPPAINFGQTPPVLPINITDVSDEELSRIASAFHSCFARAQILQSQDEGLERAAEHLENEAERDAYVYAYEMHKSEIPEEKRTQPTSLEAARRAAERDAEMAPKVREYRAKKVRHGIEWRHQRALGAGYDKAVWRIDKELDRRARLATNSRAT
jgi:hypothetical protein